MSLIEFVGFGFFWFVILGAITSAVAKSKGHARGPWFIFGGLLFIVALPLLLLSANKTSGRNCASKACPYCGQSLAVTIMKCPACHRSQPVTATSNQQAWEKTVGSDDDVARWAKANEHEK